MAVIPDSEHSKDVGLTDLTIVSSKESQRGEHTDQDTLLHGEYITGMKLYLLITGLCLLLFLTNMEVSIISTALIGIITDLGDFSKRTWVITSYLITYVGFLIIWAKMSDIFGRKTTICTSALIFIIWSGICGAAQTLQQLIIFRAMQGIGASGIYAITQIIMFELVPKEKWPGYMTVVSAVFCLSYLLGPILGGVINDGTTWRWVFLINVPLASIALVLLITLLPRSFPYHGITQRLEGGTSRLKRVDLFGTFLLLVATALLVSGLQEAGVDYAWNSGFTISFLTLSGIGWIAFLYWSYHITRKSGPVEPIFPWRFLQSRVCIATMLCGFFTGPSFSVAIFLIPQRFQVINEIDALGAGIRLLAFTLFSPVASFSAMVLMKTIKLPPLYIVITGSILQVIGFSLLTTIPSTSYITTAQYIYEGIAGFGTGINITLVIMMVPYSVPLKDRAVAVGSLNQIRFMGGVIGLAVVAAAMNSYLVSNLSSILTPVEVADLLSSDLASLPPDKAIAEQIITIFADGYTLQMKILAGLAAGQIPASLLMWQRNQIRL